MISRSLGATGAIIAIHVVSSCGEAAPSPAAGLPCMTPDPLLQPPENPALGQADEAVQAESVSELAAASELVVIGQVQSAEPAELIPDGPDGKGRQYEHLKVQILQLLAGNEVAGAQIVVRQASLDHDKVAVTNGLNPAQVGECAVFFLVPSKAPDTWRVTSSQGRYAIDSAGRLVGAEADSPVVTQVEGLTLPELTAALQQR